jgi:hypothetical protein
MGSAARFAPGSLAKRQQPDKDVDKEVEVVHMDVGAAPGTPRAGSAAKRKSDGSEAGSTPKVRPR